MDITTLNSIDMKNRGDHERCLLEMLAHRVQVGGRLTWRDLCDCLGSYVVAREDLVYPIERWLMAGIQRIT